MYVSRRPFKCAFDHRWQGLTRVLFAIPQVVAQALTFLRDTVKAEAAQVEGFKSAAQKLYPHANVLQTQEERAAQKKGIADARRTESQAGNEDIQA